MLPHAVKRGGPGGLIRCPKDWETPCVTHFGCKLALSFSGKDLVFLEERLRPTEKSLEQDGKDHS